MTDDITSYRWQAAVSNQNRILADFVMAANIVSLSKESMEYQNMEKLAIYSSNSRQDIESNLHRVQKIIVNRYINKV